MTLATVDEEWIPTQVKVFTRWVQNQLKDIQNIQVNDITKDLTNGVALVQLAKILTENDTPHAWISQPQRTVDMVQNLDMAVDMFTKDGVKLVGISGKDVNDNNEKLILGLIWSLILHYSIGRSVSNENMGKDNNLPNDKLSDKNSKNTLLSWAIDRTANYPNINNFKPYDLSMCALLDSYVPEKVNYYSLDPKDSEHNSQLATKVMNELNIPVFIYPEDLNQDHDVDHKTLLTQLSTVKVVLDNVESSTIKENSEPKIEEPVETPVESQESTMVDNLKIQLAEKVEKLTQITVKYKNSKMN